MVVTAILALVLSSAATAQPPSEPHEDEEQRLVARFRGRFTDGGIPNEDVRAIPLGGVDLWFVLTASVDEVLEGELPEPWEDVVRFAVHSPSLFFGLQGVSVPESRHYPEGVFVFELWRSKKEDGGFRLELTAPSPP